MKIYIGHSKELNYKKELYKPIRESKLNQEHEIILPHEIFQDAKDFDTKEIVKICDLFIAEVSFPSTGLGIEIGRAEAAGRKIICIYKKGSRISGSLKMVCSDFIEYSNTFDLVEKLENFVNKRN